MLLNEGKIPITTLNANKLMRVQLYEDLKQVSGVSFTGYKHKPLHCRDHLITGQELWTGQALLVHINQQVAMNFSWPF